MKYLTSLKQVTETIIRKGIIRKKILNNIELEIT